MQSVDENGKVVEMTEVDMNKPSLLAKKIMEAEEKGAVSHTIGKLLKFGDRKQIDGLWYRVEFADYVKGRYTVKLVAENGQE